MIRSPAARINPSRHPVVVPRGCRPVRGVKKGSASNQASQTPLSATGIFGPSTSPSNGCASVVYYPDPVSKLHLLRRADSLDYLRARQTEFTCECQEYEWRE